MINPYIRHAIIFGLAAIASAVSAADLPTAADCCGASSAITVAQLEAPARRAIEAPKGTGDINRDFKLSPEIGHNEPKGRNCCAPNVWNKEALKKAFYMIPKGSMSDPYGLIFQPGWPFVQNMQILSHYLGMMHTPAGKFPNSLGIQSEVYELKRPAAGYPASWSSQNPGGSTFSCKDIANPIYEAKNIRTGGGGHQLFAWWSGFHQGSNQLTNGAWNGTSMSWPPIYGTPPTNFGEFQTPGGFSSSWSPSSTQFDQTQYMKPGYVYAMRLKLQVNYKDHPDDRSWYQAQTDCPEICVGFLVDTTPMKAAGAQGKATPTQIPAF